MSCIAGIINLDGSAVEEPLVERMTRSMERRAPDGVALRSQGEVGFGHALLQLSPEGNPADGIAHGRGVWVVADARIDGQRELKEKLGSRITGLPLPTSDSELILHAYLAWGEACIDHLIGDFVFAVWDSRTRTLLCYRDHLGVRPLFYARSDRALVFASDLDALRFHPEVPDQLDENYIADFLLFGGTVDPALSVYKQIRRLPAAHKLALNEKRFSISRYWSLPPTPEWTLRPSGEYEEEFRHLFTQAVADRARERTVALELSGGMDSGAVAVALSELSRRRQLDILAFTNVSPRLTPDDREGEFATLTAEYLNLNHRLWVIDNPPFHRYQDTALATAEPAASIDLASPHDVLMNLYSQGARVLVTGQLGDALFAGQNYYRDLFGRGRFLHVGKEIWRAGRYKGTLRGLGLRGALLDVHPSRAWRSPLPKWVNPDFAKRVNLEERWAMCWEAWNGANGLRGQLEASWLASLFEGYTTLKLPMVTRHPFADVRLVAFMVGVPNAEVLGKKLLRETLGKGLPGEVRRRRKTPLMGDPVRERLLGKQIRRDIPLLLNDTKRYINATIFSEVYEAFCQGDGIESTWTSALIITPLALALWLKGYENTT